MYGVTCKSKAAMDCCASKGDTGSEVGRRGGPVSVWACRGGSRLAGRRKIRYGSTQARRRKRRPRQKSCCMRAPPLLRRGAAAVVSRTPQRASMSTVTTVVDATNAALWVAVAAYGSSIAFSDRIGRGWLDQSVALQIGASGTPAKQRRPTRADLGTSRARSRPSPRRRLPTYASRVRLRDVA